MQKKVHYILFYLLILVTTPLTAGYKYNLSACMIFQNEAPYLKEWIEFHRLLGVEHFYLYNNLSNDNYLEVLKPYISKGIVELEEWPYPSNNVQEWDPIQVAAYQDGWKKSLNQTKWLAIIDCDEFLFPVQCNSLTKFLETYEPLDHIGGVCIHWVLFGTSNVKKIPKDKLLIETLVYSSGEGNDHFKSIVRPERVEWVCSPHYVIYKEGICHCTTDNGLVIPPCTQIHKARINHYITRDLDYLYNVKIPRREKWGWPKEAMEQLATTNNKCYDPAILRFVKPLRARMFKNSKIKEY